MNRLSYYPDGIAVCNCPEDKQVIDAQLYPRYIKSVTENYVVVCFIKQCMNCHNFVHNSTKDEVIHTFKNLW